jgi:hypothetical protein
MPNFLSLRTVAFLLVLATSSAWSAIALADWPAYYQGKAVDVWSWTEEIAEVIVGRTFTGVTTEPVPRKDVRLALLTLPCPNGEIQRGSVVRFRIQGQEQTGMVENVYEGGLARVSWVDFHGCRKLDASCGREGFVRAEAIRISREDERRIEQLERLHGQRPRPDWL